ncbi:MAG: hypothetical protein EBV06_06760 [Planctomycetia bacterium]|nr:hypothetical protein [Planctomycetia bacterium]
MSWWQKMFSAEPKAAAPAVTSEQPIFAFQRRIAYQSSDELAQRLQASESAVKVYVDRVMQAANDFWKKQERGPGRLVTLVVALKPGAQVRYWLESEPSGLDPAQIRELCELLSQVPPPLVVKGPVAFGIQATLWDATGPEENWPTLPREWARASVGLSLRVPDEVLAMIWPD